MQLLSLLLEVVLRRWQKRTIGEADIRKNRGHSRENEIAILPYRDTVDTTKIIG